MLSTGELLNVDELINEAYNLNASDIHLCPGKPVLYRIDGVLRPGSKKFTEYLKEEDTYSIFENYLNSDNKVKFEKKKSYDLSFSFEQVRVRAHFYETLNGIAINFRLIPLSPRPLDDLGVPEIVKQWVHNKGGLIIVSGLANMGKTTTIAGIVDYINRNFNHKILILEDPVEYIHRDVISSIFQREVGIHSPDYAQALKDVLRENVDTVVVGEVRDANAMDAVFTMAEDGLNVITSIHAVRTIDTVERIVNMFPTQDHERIYRRLSWTLTGILNQWLVPGKMGRVLACEIMTVNNAIRNLLKEGKTQQIRSYLEQGSQELCSLEIYLKKLQAKGLICQVEQ